MGAAQCPPRGGQVRRKGLMSEATVVRAKLVYRAPAHLSCRARGWRTPPTFKCSAATWKHGSVKEIGTVHFTRYSAGVSRVARSLLSPASSLLPVGSHRLPADYYTYSEKGPLVPTWRSSGEGPAASVTPPWEVKGGREDASHREHKS